MAIFIGKKKPTVDEFGLHLQQIQRLMKKHKRIGIYSPPDGGKTRVLMRLEKKYAGTEWTIFTEAIFFAPDSYEQIREPYVYTFISPNQPMLPEFDIIYTLQYSTEYKEAVSGIRFEDGIYRPIGEYMRYSDWYTYGQNDLRGKIVKSLDGLRRYIN